MTPSGGPGSVLDALREGGLEVLGLLAGSTNQALVVRVRHASLADRAEPLLAVYKAARGERPLFDFPWRTLARREVAAYAVSEALGWGIVPPTVLREGPFGEGSVQQWIDVDPSVDVVAMVVADDPRLRRIALFDAIVNNTDRKGGHLLPVESGHVYGVDHGVTFSADPKLRTILWGWAGEPFSEEELGALRGISAALRGELGRELGSLLAGEEVAATKRRVAALLRTRRYPQPRRDWPSIPWPPY